MPWYDPRYTSNKVICLDLDGVITDFDLHFTNTFKAQYPDKAAENPRGGMIWQYINTWGPDWWATMPWTPWGKELYAFCRSLAPVLFLTSSSNDGASAMGKHQWIERNTDTRDYAICPAKWLVASPRHILIDDTPKKLNKFVEAGGYGVLFTPERIPEVKTAVEKWVRSTT
jgi:hypothetical protein